MSSTLGDRLEVFAHRAQRQVLVALFHRNPRADTPVDGDDLEFGDDALERLFDFQQYHLPELESKGFVEYERERHRVTRGPAFEEVEPLVRLMVDHPDELPGEWL